MLTYEDCLGLCDLTEEEIEALSQHEHIPEIVAVELANYLVETPAGERYISRALVEDLEAAKARGDHDKAAVLEHALKHFVATHPKGVAAVKGN